MHTVCNLYNNRHVVTCLLCSPGEAKRKHVVLLEVLGDKWRTVKIALNSVRPFVWESVALKDQPGLDPEGPEGPILEFLDTKVVWCCCTCFLFVCYEAAHPTLQLSLSDDSSVTSRLSSLEQCVP